MTALDLLPVAEPMRPHRKPRRWRRPGRARTPYVPAGKTTCPHGRPLARAEVWCCRPRDVRQREDLVRSRSWPLVESNREFDAIKRWIRSGDLAELPERFRPLIEQAGGMDEGGV